MLNPVTRRASNRQYPISTVGPDGNPKTRFVLHRGFVSQPAQGVNVTPSLMVGLRCECLGERTKKRGWPFSQSYRWRGCWSCWWSTPQYYWCSVRKSSISQQCVCEYSLLIRSDSTNSAPKSQQLTKNPHFELAWWFAPSGDQFRITGRAYVLGGPDHPTYKAFLSEHGKRLAPPSLQKDGEFNWEDERRRIFEKISPPIRASFIRPIPGTPIKKSERENDNGDGDYDPSAWPEELKMDGDEKLIKESYANFALTWVAALYLINNLNSLIYLFSWIAFSSHWKWIGASLTPSQTRYVNTSICTKRSQLLMPVRST